MAKIEEFTALYGQYANEDGEIDKEHFINLCAALDIPTPYAGSVTKVIVSQPRSSAFSTT